MKIVDCRLKIVFRTLHFCGKLLLFFCVLASIFFLPGAYADEPFDFDFDMLLEDAEPEGRIAGQGPFDFGGFIQAIGALDTEDDKAGEHTRMVRNTIRLEGKWNPVQETTRFRHDSSNRFHALASVEWDYLRFGPDHSAEDCDIRLFEGYFYWSHNPVDLSVGRQIVRWGKTDQISPVDNLNSQDLREFIIPDYEDRKIPNWMARGRLFSDFLTLEGVYLPFFEPSRIDYFGTDWAVFQHMDQRNVHEEKPARNLKNGEYGVRTAKSIAGWDLGLSYLYAWEDMPFFETFPAGGGDARITYKRTNIVGFEFETTWEKIGLRGEAAWFDSQSFLTENFTSVTKPVFHYVVGTDYSSADGWYVNLQFSEQIIRNYQEDILYFKRSNTAVNGEISKEFWRGRFKTLLRYNYGLNDKSYYLNPKIICTYIKAIDIALGVNIFGGDTDTLLGLHDEDDQVYVILKYHM